jgi:small subunit ribosomal protein S2
MNTNNPLSLMSMFEVGAHRGNRRSKLNPRLRSKVYGFSKGMALVDLAQTTSNIEEACKIIQTAGSKRRQILVVGTSKHISPLVQNAVKIATMPTPYVNNRWLGGLLTNWATIRKTLKAKEKNEKIVAKEDFFAKLPRNEQLGIQRELDKLRAIFDGLVNLKSNKPGVVIVFDSDENKVAIQEATKLNIPVVIVTHTSSVFLPQNHASTILMNTNSIKAVELVLAKFMDVYNQGLATAEAVKPMVTATTRPTRDFSRDNSTRRPQRPEGRPPFNRNTTTDRGFAKRPAPRPNPTINPTNQVATN